MLVTWNTYLEDQLSNGYKTLSQYPDHALSIFLHVQKTIQNVYDPLWHKSLIGQARVFQVKGNYPTAISIYTYLIKAPMVICKAFVSMSRCLQETEDFQEAEQVLHQGLQFWTIKNKNYTQIRLLKLALATILSTQGKNYRALKVSTHLIELFPNRRDCLLTHARCLQNFGWNDQAVSTLEKAQKKFPNDPRTYSSLIVLYQIQNDYDKATKAVQEALIRFPKNIKLLRSAARFYQNVQDYDSVYSLAIQAIELNPCDSKSYVVLARAAQNIGNLNYGIEALETFRKHHFYKLNKQIELTLAHLYALSYQYDLAFITYEKLRSYFPYDDRIQIAYSRCHQEVGHFQITIKIMTHLIQKGKVDGYIGLGHCYLLMNKCTLAIKTFKKGLIKYPSDLKLKKGLVQSYIDMKKFDKAYVLALKNYSHKKIWATLVDLIEILYLQGKIKEQKSKILEFLSFHPHCIPAFSALTTASCFLGFNENDLLFLKNGCEKFYNSSDLDLSVYVGLYSAGLSSTAEKHYKNNIVPCTPSSSFTQQIQNYRIFFNTPPPLKKQSEPTFSDWLEENNRSEQKFVKEILNLSPSKHKEFWLELFQDSIENSLVTELFLFLENNNLFPLIFKGFSSKVSSPNLLRELKKIDLFSANEQYVSPHYLFALFLSAGFAKRKNPYNRIGHWIRQTTAAYFGIKQDLSTHQIKQFVGLFLQYSST